MKIDIFSHICPQRYKDALQRISRAGKIAYELKLIEGCATLFDLERRFEILDRYECLQVLNLVSPPIEEITTPEEAPGLAKMANDEMAELIFKHPAYFVAGAAALPLNDMDAALEEADRAIIDLGFRGVQMYTSVQGRPLDSPELFPLYEKMIHFNLPIWLHPWRVMTQPDYPGETESKFKIWSTFGWPYETAAAMTRLIFGGVFEKFPGLKIITHHAGGMVPFLSERIRSGFDLWEMRTPLNPMKGLTRAPMDYYRRFYADTAIAGDTQGLMCAYEFFGPEQILFGTDMPMDSQLGNRLLRDIIGSIERMTVSEEDKEKIFAGNARALMRLPV